MKIILIGSPGSGKSIIGKEVTRILDIPYISSGDVARDMARSDASVEAILNGGGLAPEMAMREAIKNKIINLNGFVLDGFPRNFSQLNLMYTWFMKTPLVFISVICPPDICEQRVLGRDRSDANSFHRRMMYWDEYTKPMLATIKASTDRLINIVNSEDSQSNIGKIAIKIVEGL